ncbi:MAG: hypothetical protein KF894_26470 [Labilithrix sp.]|nr:hypothetical protein [Labilithrix sp.]
MKRANVLLALGSVATLLACGDLDDADKLPLAVIQGQLSTSNDGVRPASDVRVAVVWSSSATGFRTSVDVRASPVFPSKFRLELSDPPPAAVMVRPSDGPSPAPTEDNTNPNPPTRPKTTHATSSVAYAIGSVVAYEDLDGDGQLGLIDADTPPTDRVLGANEELVIVYVEGDPAGLGATDGSTKPVRGYNLLRQPRCAPSKRGPVTCAEPVWLPITTLYELPLTADPRLAEQMCRSAGGQSHASANKRLPPKPAPGPDGWPARDDASVACSADGNSYKYFRCSSTSIGLCKGTSETCMEETWTLPTTPAPAEWPCDVK